MKQWVEMARMGENAAWSALHTQYYPGLYAIALRLCGNIPAAKDAVQETFTAAYLHIGTLKDTAAFGGWIKKILINTCNHQHRQKKHHTQIVGIPGASDNWWEDELDRKMEQVSTQNRLQATIAAMPEVLRSTLLLRYFTGFNSYDQIASILSIPVGTVRSRMNQAKGKLAENWAQHTDAGGHIVKKNEEWNQFYGFAFGNMHHKDTAKNEFVRHLKKDLELVYTSGKTGTGRDKIEQEVHEDRKYGSWFTLDNVITSGNISVVEVQNVNSVEYPHRCPPSAVFVLFRDKSLTTKINLHIV